MRLHSALVSTKAIPLSVCCSKTSKLQVPMAPSSPRYSFGQQPGLSPIQTGNRHPKRGVLRGVSNSSNCTGPCLLHGHVPHCCSGLSCLHTPRSAAFGCLSILFLLNSHCKQIGPHLHPCDSDGAPRDLHITGTFCLALSLSLSAFLLATIEATSDGAPHRRHKN